MIKIIVENAKVEDAKTMSKWGVENWELWGGENTRFFTEKELIGWINNPREDIILVARVDGKLAGMCLLTMMRGWGYIDGYYVDSSFRRMGVGQAIITEIEKRLKAQKIGLIGLFTNLKNTSSHVFYQSIGFKSGFEFKWMEKRLKI
jgi:ribosomal protein S18 acetylase RimI-like enzyme